MRRSLLRDFESDPDRLERLSFIRRDEETTDTSRWVWFERVLDSYESQVRFIIRIEFELSIGDALGASYRENCCYSFNRVVLEVINRNMERYDNRSYDTDTEQPVVVGEYDLNIRTLREVNQLAEFLNYPYKPSP